mgnify:CR=1 FL=1
MPDEKLLRFRRLGPEDTMPRDPTPPRRLPRMRFTLEDKVPQHILQQVHPEVQESLRHEFNEIMDEQQVLEDRAAEAHNKSVEHILANVALRKLLVDVRTSPGAMQCLEPLVRETLLRESHDELLARTARQLTGGTTVADGDVNTVMGMGLVSLPPNLLAEEDLAERAQLLQVSINHILAPHMELDFLRFNAVKELLGTVLLATMRTKTIAGYNVVPVDAASIVRDIRQHLPVHVPVKLELV